MNESMVQDVARDLDELCRVYRDIGFPPTLKTMLTMQAKLHVAVDVPPMVYPRIPAIDEIDE